MSNHDILNWAKIVQTFSISAEANWWAELLYLRAYFDVTRDIIYGTQDYIL